ncbi:MAG TPA: hypothetical protein VF483_13135 [Gemmatimonadaceae bacterium]
MNKSPMRAVAVVAGLMVSAAMANAQRRDPREVQPERPTVATHAGTVAPGFLEFEWGAEFSSGPNIGIPLYLKLGLRSDLQFGWLVPFSKPFNGDLGLGDMQFALKWRLINDNPVLGDFAIQPSVTLPTSSGSSSPGVGFFLISSRALGKVSMDLNAGVTSARGAGTQSVWTISLGGPASGKWGWVGELAGFATSSSLHMQLLGGPTYRLHKSLVFDAGVILSGEGPDNTRVYLGGTTNLGRIIGR